MEKTTKHMDRSDWFALGLILLVAVLQLWNLAAVPFHPDEATHIFMSRDFITLFQHPVELSYQGAQPLIPQERYRAIDAPLARYLIGAARGLFSIPPLAADWDWSASWSENTAAGALPSPRLLLTSRTAITLPLLTALWLYYRAARRTLPGMLAVLSVALLGLNPLILLHARRAMSEGILIFGIALFLYAATRSRRNPWLVGLALGLALNAKHTAAALLPAGLYAVSILPEEKGFLNQRTPRIVQFLLAMGLVFAFLNPFYWKLPLKSIRVGLQSRFTLAEQQLRDHGQAMGLEEAGPLTKGAGIIFQSYFAAPQIQEVGNYQEDLQEARKSYFKKNPLHSWGRGWFAGSLFLILSLAGFILSILGLKKAETKRKQNLLVWILASLGLFLILLTPLPWQRYIVPLLPFTAFWTAAGLRPVIHHLNTFQQ